MAISDHQSAWRTVKTDEVRVGDTVRRSSWARDKGSRNAVLPDAEITIDDPRRKDVRELLERHLAFADSHSPPEDVHALDVAGLLNPGLTFFSCRRDRELLGVGH
jgi:hypothetical protein